MEESTENVRSVQVCRYRWVILLIFCMYAFINFLQFLQYTIISNVVAKYYNVDSSLVDLTGLVFMIVFIVFVVPSNYLIEKYNLRIIALAGSGLTAAGNLLKLASVAPDRFYVVLLSQSLCASGQVFVLSIPSKLTSMWFGPDEVSRACALAIFGTQIGIAIGCIVPTHMVTNSDEIESIGENMFTMLSINAAVTCIVFVLVLAFFRAKPKFPPSLSQINITESNESQSLLEIAKQLFRNKEYWLLLMVFGISNGLWTSFGILINQIYLNYFPKTESDIGVISCISVIAGGCFGSVIFGYILDKWHQFKLTSFGIMFGSAISYIFVIITLEQKLKLATYFSFPIFAFFIGSSLLVGFEFTTELMYPISESASCSILNMFMFLFSIAFTLIITNLINIIGYTYSQVIVFIILVFNSCIVYFISPNLLRRQANISLQ